MNLETTDCRIVPARQQNEEPPPNRVSILRGELQWLWNGLLSLKSRRPRRLRLCESLALGDRRFVAVIEYEGRRFLVGGTSGSLALLDRLDTTANDPKAEATGESR